MFKCNGFSTAICRIICFSLYFLLGGAFISGCQSVDLPASSEQDTNRNSIFHQDSTLYFASKTASVSMRASFVTVQSLHHEATTSLLSQTMDQGYRLQFRSVDKSNPLLAQVLIIAGGEKITLAEGSFFIPDKKGVTLSLSLEDSRFISKQNDAVLNFKYNDESLFFSIRNHQLKPFLL